jgi:hypothetical protein
MRLLFSPSARGWWDLPILLPLASLSETRVSVVWGEEDEILPCAALAPLVQRAVRGADLYLVRRALHNPAHSDAASVGAAIVDCVRKSRGHARAPIFCAGAKDVMLDRVAQSAAGASAEAGTVARVEVPLRFLPPPSLAPPARHGVCLGCQLPVQGRKSYFVCGCKAFSFFVSPDAASTVRHWAAFELFVAELFERGTFDARKSAAVVHELPVAALSAKGSGGGSGGDERTGGSEVADPVGSAGAGSVFMLSSIVRSRT